MIFNLIMNQTNEYDFNKCLKNNCNVSFKNNCVLKRNYGEICKKKLRRSKRKKFTKKQNQNSGIKYDNSTIIKKKKKKIIINYKYKGNYLKLKTENQCYGNQTNKLEESKGLDENKMNSGKFKKKNFKEYFLKISYPMNYIINGEKTILSLDKINKHSNINERFKKIYSANIYDIPDGSGKNKEKCEPLIQITKQLNEYKNEKIIIDKLTEKKKDECNQLNEKKVILKQNLNNYLIDNFKFNSMNISDDWSNEILGRELMNEIKNKKRIAFGKFIHTLNNEENLIELLNVLTKNPSLVHRERTENEIINSRLSSLEIAVNEHTKYAESSYLLHTNCNRTNNDQNDESIKPDQKTKNAENAKTRRFVINHDFKNFKNKKNKNFVNKKFEFSQVDNLNCDRVIKYQECKNYKIFELPSDSQTICELNLIPALSNKENLFNHPYCEQAAKTKKLNKSKVIINYCEKIELEPKKEDKLIRTQKNLRRFSNFCKFKNANPLENSYNNLPFSLFDSVIREHQLNSSELKSAINRIEWADIVKKVNSQSSDQTRSEFIISDEADNDLTKKSLDQITNVEEIRIDQVKHEIFKQTADNEKRKKTNLNSQKSVIIKKIKAIDKMSALLSPSNEAELFDESSSTKMDPIITSTNKPLKGLLKKTKSIDSCGNSINNLTRKKRRVKFAETMMVFCDDWPEELMPQFMPLAIKSPSEFNLVEIAAQSYMFEPPAEYKDYLPFDPPDDYRDQLNSTNDLTFSNLPNHTLLQMYENNSNEESVNDSLLSKLEFNDDMFMKFDYANGTSDQQIIEENEQLDTYKEMILNDSNEMLEDDIIGVLKEDDLLQEIGSQINSLDKNDSLDNEDFNIDIGNNVEGNINAETNSNQCSKNSIIIVNKNVDCHPIQIITSNESSDISFSNMEDNAYNTISPNGSLQDLASDSSITSQDTIIMMTNAILTDKTNKQPNLTLDNSIDLKPQIVQHRMKLSDLQNKREDSNSKDSGITIDYMSDNQIKTKDEECLINNDENNNNEENQEQQIKSTNDTNGVPQLIQKYSKSDIQSSVKSMNQEKITKDGSISVSELRESFERRMSLNSDKNDSSSANSTNVNQFKQSENIYQNISLNNTLNYATSTEDEGKQWQNEKKIVEYTNEPKVLMPNKLTASLSQSNYSPDNKNQKSCQPSSNLPIQQTNQTNTTHLHIQNINQECSSPQLQHKIINANENSLLINNQQVMNQQNKLNQITQGSNQAISVQKIPNIYFSIDRRTLPHQIKMIPTQKRSLLYESNNNNGVTIIANNKSNLKQQSTIIPHFHLVPNKNEQQQSQQQKSTGQQQSNQPIKNVNANQITNLNSNKMQAATTIRNNQNNYQTLPIRFAANAKQIRLQGFHSHFTSMVDGKCCTSNQVNSALNQSAQTQVKPQLILIHSYPSALQQQSSIGPTNNQKAIAIKIHPVNNQQLDKTNYQSQTTPAFLTTNGKIITALAPNGTIINQNLVNSNAFIQQTLLHRNSSSSFPNASEIRRRDGLNAHVWNDQNKSSVSAQQQINKQQAKDELESLIQQDLQRTERIKKPYSVAEDDADDPTFGFAQRPSVKGIKSKFGGSAEQIIKQVQPQLSGQDNKFANIIQLNAENKSATLQRPSPQIILTSNHFKSQDLSKLTGTNSNQTIPIIQKTHNNQRHVYLIQQNQIGNNFQERTSIQKGGALPRNSNVTLNTPNRMSNSINASVTNNNSNDNSQTNNLNSTNGQHLISSSLGDNNDDQLKTNLINIEQAKQLKPNQTQQSKIMFYNNVANSGVLNCNKIALINTSTSTGQGQSMDDSAKYKTISMPNAAFINGLKKTFAAQQQQTQNNNNSQLKLTNQPHLGSQTKSGPKLINTLVTPTKDQITQLNLSSNTSTIKSSNSQNTKQIPSNNSSSSSSVNSSLNSSTSTTSSTNSTNQCNNQLTNNSNLVKEGGKNSDFDKASSHKQVAKEEIFYSMNV